MKMKNFILRYIGVIFFLLGVVMNIKMFYYNEWPTIIFFIISGVGIVQILASFFLKDLKILWQLFWAILPFLIIYLFIKI